MSEHKTKYGEVDPTETASLQAEAEAEGSTPVGYFLTKAAASDTQSEREYWLGRVDSARYFEALERNRARLDASAVRNMDAERRLRGAEATLMLERTVGNACVLKLLRGERVPPGGYRLIRRKAGEIGTEGFGGVDYPGHWVVQGLEMNVIHEFAVVSENDVTAHSVQGPWLAVPIGSVSTQAIQAAERERAEVQYAANEAAEAERQRQHSVEVAQRRKNRRDAERQQAEQARIENARREREWAEKKAAHEKAVKELPLVRPQDIGVRLQGLPDGRVLAHIHWTRGQKKPLFYKMKVDGTVLGDDPGGQWSGGKPAGHRYTRTVEVPKGRAVKVTIAGVTNHGDGDISFPIKAPADLCEQPVSRMDRIVAAVRSYTGRRTRDGRPWLRPLRKHAGMKNITGKERNEAHKLA